MFVISICDKETKGWSSGQTPFTIITKITKTASPKKQTKIKTQEQSRFLETLLVRCWTTRLEKLITSKKHFPNF